MPAQHRLALPGVDPDPVQERAHASTYVSLIRWTEKGISSVKDAPKRIDDAKKMFRAVGAEMKAFYIRTETLRAFTEGEYRKIIGSLD
jgi:uncharacterized protein with GYD domain